MTFTLNKSVLSMAMAIVPLVSTIWSVNSFGQNDYQALTVEELRLTKASQVMPIVVNRLDKQVSEFEDLLQKAESYTSLTQLVIRHGKAIWQAGVKQVKNSENFDDRSLYWARLKMFKAMRQLPLFQELLPYQQQKLLWQLSLLSRGQSDVVFDKKTDKKILITGFDPFFLDRNIDQSNPSGAAVLALDDIVVSSDGKSAEIESLIIPVRFADFDQGMIEELLEPYIGRGKVDMIVTISMGRDDFDLERFPGLRRSAKAPDNLNVYTGADSKNPKIPLLASKPLTGSEFVEFSLPVEAMKRAVGRFAINDNHNVTTTSGKLHDQQAPKYLRELRQQISVQGSGGGYLSNEISYRSIRLRDLHNPVLPVGHIHTPRIKAFAPKTTADIIKQIKRMLTLAVPKI